MRRIRVRSYKRRDGVRVQQHGRTLNRAGFRIGSSGLVATEKFPLVVGRKYPMGASTSPDTILITGLSKDRISYKRYPFDASSKELVIERWIGEDLIAQGVSTMRRMFEDAYPGEGEAIFEKRYGWRAGTHAASGELDSGERVADLSDGALRVRHAEAWAVSNMHDLRLIDAEEKRRGWGGVWPNRKG